MKKYMDDLEIKKNKVILKTKENIITKEFLGENALKSVIKELTNSLDYFYGTSEELMKTYSTTDFSQYTKDEIDDINLFYINTINITIKVYKDDKQIQREKVQSLYNLYTSISKNSFVKEQDKVNTYIKKYSKKKLEPLK